MRAAVTVSAHPGEEGDAALIRERAAREAGVAPGDITALTLLKRSLDARRGRAVLRLRFAVYTGGDAPGEDAAPRLPEWKRACPSRRVADVGAGPAGLFAALRLLEAGVTPVLVEQGKRTGPRLRDIAAANASGVVDARSNYCFGEGGAGAFSDGKLFTRSGKRGDARRILAVLRAFGADASVLTDARPHIGTDRLPAIVSAITDTIIALGGEVHFQTECTGLVLRAGRAAGVRTVSAAGGAAGELEADAVILCPGHSAPGVYGIVEDAARRLRGAGALPALAAKAFACGVRVEHPRRVIDSVQYRRTGLGDAAPGAASYRLSARVDGRGVYSFCVCPGGVVVPAASGPGEIVVNGMSASARNSRWTNGGIVAETLPEDCGEDALAGLRFRGELEARAAAESGALAAPAQRLTDFLARRRSETLPPSSYAPGLVSSRLDEWLPPFIARRIAEGCAAFEQVMRGFVCADAVVIAPETRTSSPVRILRDGRGESTAVPGLYPCGEGAGYSGGIVSSAMDGEKAAAAAAALYFD